MALLSILEYFSAFYVLVVVGLYATAATIPSMHGIASFIARLLASWAAMCFCATYGVIASIFLRIIGKPGLSQWTVARSFKWTMWWATGVTFEIVEGEEHLLTRPCVIVGNHQTELDVLMLGVIFPQYCSVTAKSSLKWMPFLGQFMALSKTVFINRTNRQSAITAFDAAAQTMHRERQSVYIFPEGTRSYADEPMLLPFKKGAFHLAVQAQVPVVPVVVANYSHVLNVKRRIFRAGRIPVKVLPPIETKGLESKDVDGLTTRVREMMLKDIGPLTLKARAQGAPVAIPASMKKLE